MHSQRTRVGKSGSGKQRRVGKYRRPRGACEPGAQVRGDRLRAVRSRHQRDDDVVAAVRRATHASAALGGGVGWGERRRRRALKNKINM